MYFEGILKCAVDISQDAHLLKVDALMYTLEGHKFKKMVQILSAKYIFPQPISPKNKNIRHKSVHLAHLLLKVNKSIFLKVHIWVYLQSTPSNVHYLPECTSRGEL